MLIDCHLFSGLRHWEAANSAICFMMASASSVVAGVKSYCSVLALQFALLPTRGYRGKKNHKLTWTSRGSMPRGMREQMKELKLKPDALPDH